MVTDGIRICDVCNEAIPKGTKYFAEVVPQEKAKLFKSIADQDPEMAPTFNVDSNGNVRLDICLDCKLRMGKPDEIVN